jgi:glutamate synthase domain-containing protein 2
VALPFRVGFARIYATFASAGIADRVVFNGSGKLGLPDNAIVAFALGCDMVSVAREAMLSIGCIQAQRCHTGECPTGIATQDRWLSHGLDPAVKSVRAANYIRSLRRDLLKVSEACGVSHPSLIGVDDLDILDGQESATPLRTVYGYQHLWGQPSLSDQQDIDALMAHANRSSTDNTST